MADASHTDGFDIAALFERIPIPLYATARDGTVLAANAAFREIWQSESVDDLPRAEDLYEESAERTRLIADLDNSRIGLLDWEQMIRSPGGTRWIHPLTRVVRDTDGKVDRLEGGFLTITETGDLDVQRQQLQSILEHTADPVVVLDDIGRITWANASARRTLQTTEARIRFKPKFDELLDEPIDTDALLARAPTHGETTFEVKSRVHHFWFNLERHVDADGEPAFYSLIGRDLSLLDQTRAQLAETVTEHDRVISMVAHEIRTPLTSVLGLSETLADHLEAAGDAHNAQLAAILRDQAQDLSRIVSDLVDSSGSANVPIVLEPVDLSEVARDSIESSGIRQEDAVTVTGSGVALADPLRARQIVRNLLTNAFRYGRPPVSIAIESDGPWVRLAVIDHGNGVPEHLSHSLYDPFVTSGAETSTSMGLGLAVAHTLATAMAGSLTHSHEGGETIFTLQLPRP